jgi:hypothetical protein
MTTLGREFIWPDVAGTPTDPDTAYATVGPGPVYEIGAEAELLVELRCTVGVPRAWGIYAEVSMDRGTTWYPWAEKVVQCSASAAAVDGARIVYPVGVQARFSVRRWGGNANTRLAVFATTRISMPSPYLNGQPLELVSHQEAGVECWGDGAGAAVAAPASPAYAPSPAPAATQLRIPTGEADTLEIEYTVAAFAATTIEFVVQESRDDGATFWPRQAVNSVAAGVVAQSTAFEQVTGTLGTFRTREISITPGTLIRIDAQKTGGGAATLLAYARLLKTGV